MFGETEEYDGKIFMNIHTNIIIKMKKVMTLILNMKVVMMVSYYNFRYFRIGIKVRSKLLVISLIMYG